MPEAERTSGNIIAYLVPTEIVADAVRECHRKWLDSNPRTMGENTTWNLWFNKDEYKSDGRQDKQNYFKKLDEYRLPGTVSSIEIESELSSCQQSDSSSVKREVEIEHRRIAHVASVSPEAVKLSVEYL